ncbi:MAG: CerR family C-terminal domain-containing protein, partial [Rhodospirillales bacterium]|nr:CerR family C-terminal domain-containing protein [Rhodospirillales bacterium]
SGRIVLYYALLGSLFTAVPAALVWQTPSAAQFLWLLVSALAAAAMGRDAGDPVCAIQAHTMIGQIVVFGLARVVLQKRLDWDGYTPERTDLIARTVTASVLASLGLPMPEPQGDPS